MRQDNPVFFRKGLQYTVSTERCRREEADSAWGSGMATWETVSRPTIFKVLDIERQNLAVKGHMGVSNGCVGDFRILLLPEAYAPLGGGKENELGVRSSSLIVTEQSGPKLTLSCYDELTVRRGTVRMTFVPFEQVN